MKYIIWLDDIRNPFNYPWYNIIKQIQQKTGVGSAIWVKTYEQFVYTITNNGIPSYICFDNDLGQEKEGHDCAKWLINYCLDHNIDAPDFYIQSDNGPAQDNIRKLINNYKNFYKENNE